MIHFPTNLQSILKEVHEVYGNEINRQSLRQGRLELLEKGFIAKTLFTEDADINFDREPFLPVDPEIIWEENKENVIPFWKTPEEMAFRESRIKELQEYYINNFKKYGLGIEKGSITILCYAHWLPRILMANRKYTKSLDAMANVLNLFQAPDHSKYHEKMFKSGLTVREVLDTNIKRKMFKDEEIVLQEIRANEEQRLVKIKKIREEYRNQIRLKYFETYTTSRITILYNDKGPFMAFDFRTFLSIISEGAPCYTGTIYLQAEAIDRIKENFEAAWENGIDWE